MEKRKWPWKRRSSDMSAGESESSGSFSSHSERHSDEQEVMKETQNESLQSPEVTSKATITDEELKESVKSLTEKLSAALINVSAKEDLVKQHAKVAEEAVAGWEKAENEVATLKQQLEAAVQQNLNLEVKVSHLDGALKECVKQLRQARDELEKKAELEMQIIDLQAEAEAAKKAENSASIDPNTLLKLEALEKGNLSLKQELISRCEDLEIMTIERDLSTQAAENASKLQLESIKKIAKLEAECRRLQSLARKSSPLNNRKSIESELLISELDRFKNEKPPDNDTVVEIDMMDDFLEMERLAALPEAKSNAPSTVDDNPLRGELDLMAKRVSELEEKFEKIEAEKLELQNALDERAESLKAAEIKLEVLQKELSAVNEAKKLLEVQLDGVEVEMRTMSANVDELKAEIEEERQVSAELKFKCLELENELTRMIQENELQQNGNSNSELKIKQEDLAVAADKLAECQNTIASLGRQLQSIATLEDFLIDTSNIPGLSTGPSGAGGDMWKLSSNHAVVPTRDPEFARMPMESFSHLENSNETSSPSSSLSASATNHINGAKSWNSFGKFFSRSKSVVEFENSRD